MTEVLHVGAFSTCVCQPDKHGPDGSRSDVIPAPRGVPVTVSWVGIVDSSVSHIDIIEFPVPENGEYFRGYKAEYFEPIVERKTDISIFTKLLNPSPTKEGVEA